MQAALNSRKLEEQKQMVAMMQNGLQSVTDDMCACLAENRALKVIFVVHILG